MQAAPHAEAEAAVTALAEHAAQRTERLNTIRRDLRAEMTDALAGKRRLVRTIDTLVRSGPVVLSQPIEFAVLESIDLAMVQRELLDVLKNSRCPGVAQFKTALIAAYVNRVAPLVADAREQAAAA